MTPFSKLPLNTEGTGSVPFVTSVLSFVGSTGVTAVAGAGRSATPPPVGLKYQPSPMPSHTAPGSVQGVALAEVEVAPGTLQYQGDLLKRKVGRPPVVSAMMPSSTMRR